MADPSAPPLNPALELLPGPTPEALPPSVHTCLPEDADNNTPESLTSNEERPVRHNTRFRHLSDRGPVQQTLHLGFIVGKTQDPLVSAEWMQQACSDEGMWQSDEAVGQYIAHHYPHVQVTIYRPRLADIPRLAARFADCDMVHVLESEQFLGRHNYKNYKQLFQVLHPFGARLRPSLDTMQFIMSKVDYINVLQANDIPHVPTFILQRPSDFRQFQQQFADLVPWLQALDPLPERLVAKPSHSGSKLHFSLWPVRDLRRSAFSFVNAMRRLFVASQKPFVLVQPFLQGLADLEYRLYFVNRQFVSCVSTKWKTSSQGKAAIKRSPVDNPVLIAQMRPIAQRAVDLLPTDSALYRVDMFLHEGRYAINEIEMIDGDLMPEYHDDDTDIIKLVGDALLRMADAPAPPPGVPRASLPVLDTTAVPVGSEEDWRGAACCLKEALKGLVPERAGLRQEEQAQLDEWTGLLSELFTGPDLAELCGQLQLPVGPTKRARAAAVGRDLMEEDRQRRELAGEPAPKRHVSCAVRAPRVEKVRRPPSKGAPAAAAAPTCVRTHTGPPLLPGNNGDPVASRLPAE
eukprot:EG_transcript_6402